MTPGFEVLVLVVVRGLRFLEDWAGVAVEAGGVAEVVGAVEGAF